MRFPSLHSSELSTYDKASKISSNLERKNVS